MSTTDFDWDLPKAPREYHRAGRAFSFAFWNRYHGFCEDFLEWKKFVRGWEGYPKASADEAWIHQTEFLLQNMRPLMERLRELTLGYQRIEDWHVVRDRPRKGLSPEQKEIKILKVQLKETWAKRPKARR
tara:strand:+ start:952 stop:1341 length:390 start_codon:yes stop_codon:yes gene_type:complete